MSMYLRVSIPYRYALPKSPTDSGIVDVFPLMDKSSALNDHITLGLNSLQTPWSQINKKNEVFTFDPQTSFYPAYNSTSKIRPKMIPKTVKLLHATFGSIGDILGERETGYLQNDGFQNHAHREKHYQGERKKELMGLYTAYKPFLDTKTISPRRMMDWAATQPDLIGVWNQGQVSADVFQRTTQKAYRLTNSNEDGVSPSHLSLRIVGSVNSEEKREPGDLGVSYSQKVLGIAPYASHPTFTQRTGDPHRPIGFRYRFVSEMEAAKTLIRHPDFTSTWQEPSYNPPSLDWEGAGFPKIAPSKSKVMYGRQPVQVNTHYSESGFTKDTSTVIQRCLVESNAPHIWFSTLVEPVNTQGDYIPIWRHLRGNIIEWSALSWMERSYFDSSESAVGERTDFGKVVWKQQSYAAQGYGLGYYLSSDSATWDGMQTHHRNFPTGNITRNFRWDDIPVDGGTTPTNYMTKDWRWGTVGNRGRLEVGAGVEKRHKSAANSVGHSQTLPAQSFEDERIHPALAYRITTKPYGKGEETSRRMGEVMDSGIMLRPSQIQAFQDNGDKGRVSLSHLLNSGVMFSTYARNPYQATGVDTTAIQHLLEAALVTRPADFEVKVERGGIVSITQKVTRGEIIKAFSGYDYWDDLVARLKAGEKKGERWAYKVYFLTHSDGGGISILATYPTFLHNPFPKAVSNGKTWGIQIISPHIFRSCPSASVGRVPPSKFDNLLTVESGTETKTLLPFTVAPHRVSQSSSDAQDPLLGDEVMEYVKETAFGGYQYSLLHLRDGMTLSDPVNTLPIDYKRGKVSVKRPFTYTSVIPALGEKGTTFTPIRISDLNLVEQLDFSPVNRYVVSESETDTQLSLPTYQFKAQNANSRMNKYRRSGRRNAAREGYSDGKKPNDYRIYSQFIFPFGDFTSGCLNITQNFNFSGVIHEFNHYLTTRAKQFPSKDEALKIPVANQPIHRQRITTRTKYGSQLPMNLGVWNLGIPTTVIPETYSLVGRELGVLNWLRL